MKKLFLLVILGFGAFMGLAIFFPGSTETAFTLFTHNVPWIALGVCGVGYLGYKSIK